jgi:hypothetical protein
MTNGVRADVGVDEAECAEERAVEAGEENDVSVELVREGGDEHGRGGEDEQREIERRRVVWNDRRIKD